MTRYGVLNDLQDTHPLCASSLMCWLLLRNRLSLRSIVRLTLLLLPFLLVACSAVSRHETALRIASSASLTEKRIDVPPFILTSFERVQLTGHVAHLYIEGDGLAWLGRNVPSLDPTPKNPVALKLAAQDSASNVIYLARPGQYSKLTTDEPCPQKYWTSHRFASEVIASMDAALDDVKSRNHITGFHLIGFSGGANIAVLLAAQRHDVLSLRTVAGNLDHVLLNQIHGVSQMPASLNAKDKAQAIRDIPQYHFVGGQDEIVTNAIVQSFIHASGPTNCIRWQVVPSVSHDQGWAALWPSLLKRSMDCPDR